MYRSTVPDLPCPRVLVVWEAIIEASRQGCYVAVRPKQWLEKYAGKNEKKETAGPNRGR